MTFERSDLPSTPFRRRDLPSSLEESRKTPADALRALEKALSQPQEYGDLEDEMRQVRHSVRDHIHTVKQGLDAHVAEINKILADYKSVLFKHQRSSDGPSSPKLEAAKRQLAQRVRKLADVMNSMK